MIMQYRDKLISANKHLTRYIRGTQPPTPPKNNCKCNSASCKKEF